MRRRVICGLPLTAALIVGVGLSGCGSSSTTNTATTPTITKADFIAKSNAICAKGNKEQQAGFAVYGKKHSLKPNQEPTKAQETELVNSVFVPNVQSQIDAVKALGVPSGEEQQVNSALEASQQALNKVKAKPELAFAKTSPFAAAGKQLHALGSQGVRAEQLSTRHLRIVQRALRRPSALDAAPVGLVCGRRAGVGLKRVGVPPLGPHEPGGADDRQYAGHVEVQP